MNSGADRERFEAWLGRQMSAAAEAGAGRAEAVGGPIDGRGVASAVAQYGMRGEELIVPALRVLTGPRGERSCLEHVYRKCGSRMVYAGTRAVGA